MKLGQTRYCKFCGSELEYDDTFCLNCRKENNVVNISKILLIIAFTLLLSYLWSCASDISNNSNDNFTIQDCVYTKDFRSASAEIGLDLGEIKNLQRVGEWINGTFYSFTYQGSNGKIFCDSNNKVDSINFSDTKVYLNGFESLKLSDYLINLDTVDTVRSLAEQKVKASLAFPDSANFSATEWGFAHWNKYYGVSGFVKAKNTFGVVSEIKFSLIFEIMNDGYGISYFSLDNKKILGNIPNLDETRTEIVNESSDGEIISIVEGVKGSYGKDVVLDGYAYIWYEIPEGEYSVYCESNSCKVYLDKNKTIKNSDGYTECVNIVTLNFVNDKNSQKLVVEKDQHIELMIRSKIRIVPIK